MFLGAAPALGVFSSGISSQACWSCSSVKKAIPAAISAIPKRWSKNWVISESKYRWVARTQFVTLHRQMGATVEILLVTAVHYLCKATGIEKLFKVYQKVVIQTKKRLAQGNSLDPMGDAQLGHFV
jgi:hypothetical protein